MKKTLLLIAVAALVATAFSFAAARWLTTRATSERLAMPTLHDTTWLQRELALTDSQQQQLAQQAGAYHERFTALCTKHCEARVDLGKELARPSPDAARCRELVEAMNRAQADAEHATLDHILKVRSMLTDEQAQRYGQLVCDQVCSMIPAGGQ